MTNIALDLFIKYCKIYSKQKFHIISYQISSAKLLEFL